MGSKPKTKQPRTARSVNTSSTVQDSGTKDAKTSLVDRLHEHLALIVSVVVGTSIVIRVFASARYDPVTAMALVQAAGVGTVALGGLLASIPFFAFAAFFVFLVEAAKSFSTIGSSEMSLRGLLMGVGAAICALVMPVGLLVVAVFFCIVRGIWWILQRQRLGQGRSGSGSARRKGTKPVAVALSVSLGVGIVLLTSTYFGQPWVPSETIEVRGKAGFRGYVLTESKDEVVVMRDESRRIVRIKKPELVKRSLCRGDVSSGDGVSLAALLVREPGGDDYPRCPS